MPETHGKLCAHESLLELAAETWWNPIFQGLMGESGWLSQTCRTNRRNLSWEVENFQVIVFLDQIFHKIYPSIR